MAASRRRQSLSVIEQLQETAYRFEFFQAVRLLERAVLFGDTGEQFSTEPLAGASPPNRELLRFRAQSSFSFVAADVLKLSAQKLGDSYYQNVDSTEDHGLNEARDESALVPRKQWMMEVGFGGLIGSQGVMPHFLTEIVHRELREKNTALKDFLDVFHHRNISLFYRAWKKYQLPANFEVARLRKNRELDSFTSALASIAGLGTSEMRYRMSVPDDALYGMAGLLGRQQCSAAALESMIRQYFGLQVHIEQFQGCWDELPMDVLTRLPSRDYPQGVNNRLGVNTIMGAYCFQAQNKFQVVVEPMEYGDHMAIAPGSEKLEALKSFIQFSAGTEMDFEISVTLVPDQVAPVQLATDSHHQPLLGWNTHMSTDQPGDECIQISLSADQISPDEALPVA